MKRMYIFWAVAFILWVLMVSAVLADENPQSSYAKIERIFEYRTTGDYGPTVTAWEPDIFGNWSWRTYKLNETGFDIELHRPHTVVVMTVQADGSDLRAVTMLGFRELYGVDELVKVVKTQDGRWLPLFEKLKEIRR